MKQYKISIENRNYDNYVFIDVKTMQNGNNLNVNP